LKSRVQNAQTNSCLACSSIHGLQETFHQWMRRLAGENLVGRPKDQGSLDLPLEASRLI
jgi:hypothetical protein